MHYEELKIGLVKSFSKKIDKKTINKFIDLTGDKNPIHTNKKYASKTYFKKPIAHGMLSASFISNVIGNKLPGPGAIWISQNLEFLNPVNENDVIKIIVKVLSKDDRFNIIKLNTEIYNQEGIKIISGNAQVKIIENNRKIKKVKKTKEDMKIRSLNQIKEKNKIFSSKKTALIIGGTGIIGSSVYSNFIKSNFNTVLHYKSNIKKARFLLKIKNKNSNIKLSCDIEKYQESELMFKKIIKKYGRIDFIVNCSTTKIMPVKFEDLSWQDFNEHINSQLKGSFNIIKLASNYMSLYGGKIVNISSVFLESSPNGFYHYIAAKGALQGFVKSIATELANKNIKINTISPSMVESDLSNSISDKIKMINIAKTPLKRLCQPKDIADAVMFLASDKSNFICGETIRINGGQIMI